MSAIFLFVGLTLAAALVFGGFQSRLAQVRIASLAAAFVVLFVAFTLASFQFVKENEVGIVIKNVGWKSLPAGKIIATEGEKGPQAHVLPPGWHPWYWPFIYKIEKHPVQEIPAGQVGLLAASDGRPLPGDATYAPEWPEGDEKRMAQDAVYFLTDGGGYRGPQTSVLKPGSHRINPKLFKVKLVPATTVDKAQAAVIKSNVGEAVSSDEERPLVERHQRGIWRQPLGEGQYYLNTDAHEVTIVSTQARVVEFTAKRRFEGGEASRRGDSTERADIDEREIEVITSDGFAFPVDVRIQYEITKNDAPLLVSTVRDDQDGLLKVLNSTVRAVFRNNAERVKALDYVKNRGQQELQSKDMLQEKLKDVGVTIIGVYIGGVGNEATLGALLKTQKDREIAREQTETFKQQQIAAEQKKQLTKTEQEAEEEKRLATARYAVQIAEQDKEKRIIAAGAEAEAIKIQAQAQADAYQLIAEQIGAGNAALVEVLKIVGERGIQITPRVMVSGGNGADGGNGQTTALIGTMLDTMVDRTPRIPAAQRPQP